MDNRSSLTAFPKMVLNWPGTCQATGSPVVISEGAGETTGKSVHSSYTAR